MEVSIDKQVLFQILHSHQRLAQSEYERNPAYNNDHFSYKAEIATLGILDDKLIKEYFDYIDNAD